MKRTILTIALVLISFTAGFFINKFCCNDAICSNKTATCIKPVKSDSLMLGAFSISLSVKDLHASKEFYEKMGFHVLGGGMEKNYLIMKNQNTLIGLFQGMFEGNILTFNPGWDENGENVMEFDDVRKIQQELMAKGLVLSALAEETSTGPASIMLSDPDSNLILLDQHR